MWRGSKKPKRREQGQKAPVRVGAKSLEKFRTTVDGKI
jgi:hypothetical protein